MAPTTAKLAKAELELCEPTKDGKKLKPGATITTLRFAFNPKDYSLSLSGGYAVPAEEDEAWEEDATGIDRPH